MRARFINENMSNGNVSIDGNNVSINHDGEVYTMNINNAHRALSDADIVNAISSIGAMPSEKREDLYNSVVDNKEALYDLFARKIDGGYGQNFKRAYRVLTGDEQPAKPSSWTPDADQRETDRLMKSAIGREQLRNDHGIEETRRFRR